MCEESVVYVEVGGIIPHQATWIGPRSEHYECLSRSDIFGRYHQCTDVNDIITIHTQLILI